MSTPSPIRPRSKAIRVLQFVVTLYAVWLVAIFFMQRSILFPRSLANQRYAPPPPKVEVWSAKRPDGVTAQALFRPSLSTSAGPRPIAMLLHGNAMLAGDWLDWADDLAAEGLHVLIPEFRGYGASEGSPTRESIVGDAAALLEMARADPRVDGDAIVLYGRSIGGAIAAEVAAATATPPAALIVHTAPARISDLAWRFAAPPFLVRDNFDAESALRSLAGRMHIQVFDHDRDEVIPRGHGARLAAAAGVELVTLRGSHNMFDRGEDERRLESAVSAAALRAAGRGDSTP